MKLLSIRTVMVLFCAAVLASCGGAGGGGTSTTSGFDGAGFATRLGIGKSGIGGNGNGNAGAAGGAGDGAPLRNALVSLTDAVGNVVNGLTDSNGKFLLVYDNAQFVAPLVLRVVDSGGNVLASVVDAVAGTGTVATANVNPLTDKIVSDILGSTVKGTDKNYTGSALNMALLPSAKANLATSINAALVAAGVTDTGAFDPIKSTYSYDGTGADSVIESLSHSRDATTGSTLLSAKLASVSNSQDGAVVPNFVTASTPLPTTLLATPTSPFLTFSKINAWISEQNRCLAFSTSARTADANCVDASGTRLVSSGFLQNGKDFPEAYRTLHSNSDTSAIQGSTLRNPVVLLVGKYAGSVSSYDDFALVEMTVLQPSTGPLAGSVASPVEYTATFLFKRDDSLSAVAGNWILNGNQRSYDLGVSTRYVKNTQLNPARSANLIGNAASDWESRINMRVKSSLFDRTTRTYVSANIRAVRVTGPGLPVAGVVLTLSSVIGTTNLAFFNQTGVVPSTNVTTGASANSYGLAGIASDGTTLQTWTTGGSNASAVLTDFSSLQAFALYKFEIFLTSNTGNTTPDATEYVRNIAPVYAPSVALNFPVNDVSPSAGLVTPSLPAVGSVNVQWTNNLNAAPVNGAHFIGGQTTPTAIAFDVFQNVSAAYTVGARPTSQLITAPGGTFPSFTSGVAGDRRAVAIWAYQGRADIQSVTSWSNF